MVALQRDDKVADEVLSDDNSDLEDEGQELSMVITALQSAVEKKNGTSSSDDKPTASGQDSSPATEEEKEKVKAPPQLNTDTVSTVLFEQPSSPIPHANATTNTSTTEDDISPPSPGTPPPRPTMENGRTSDDLDVECSANLISVNSIDLKEMLPNKLSPRQQEKAGKKMEEKGITFSCLLISNVCCWVDEPVLRAIRHLFNNRFMKAKVLFEKYAQL